MSCQSQREDRDISSQCTAKVLNGLAREITLLGRLVSKFQVSKGGSKIGSFSDNLEKELLLYTVGSRNLGSAFFRYSLK